MRYHDSMHLGRLLSLSSQAILAIAFLQGCAQLPSLEGRGSSEAFQDTTDTRLGRAARPLAQAHPGESGIFALADGREAFAARALLAEASERSLDIQYYIWRDDTTGTLLLDALRRAADRGVRVRLLLDDNGTFGRDAVLAALDAHPNIEVRLFNPFVQRRWRTLGYLTDFARLNRRMHNRSFTAYNQATIVGGRNVGDEYFDAGQGVSFSDLDVLAIGPLVNDVSKDFDRYSASDSAYPAMRVLVPVASGPDAPDSVAAAGSSDEHDLAAAAYRQAIVNLPYVRQVLAGQLPFEWAISRLLSDDPAKGLGRAVRDELMWTTLKQILKGAKQDLALVSAYFVPELEGSEYLSTLARDGVKVTVLTNSLEATDVPAVHAGYAKRRKGMVSSGVALFEVKRAFSPPPTKAHGAMGSSSVSLHAKTFSVDRSRVFIGSFNFDPRSARLNTEMGFVIDSPALAEAIANALAERVPARAYRVRLDGAGAMQWVEQRDGKEIVHQEEPGVGFWLGAFVRMLSVLPIDWLL